MTINGILGSININGSNFSGSSLQINGDKIIVDGKEVGSGSPSKNINISIEGDVNNVENRNGSITVKGNAQSVINRNGNISVNTLHGNAETRNGNINIQNKITKTIEKEVIKEVIKEVKVAKTEEKPNKKYI